MDFIARFRNLGNHAVTAISIHAPSLDAAQKVALEHRFVRLKICELVDVLPAPQRPNETEPGSPRSNGPAGDSPSDAAFAADLAKMLANPQFLPDPVFPKERYLPVLGDLVFRNVLHHLGELKQIDHIRVTAADAFMVTFVARSFGCWAIDLDAVSNRGVNGRDEFVARARLPIRRPPKEIAANAVEQHLVSRGVFKIQVDDGPSRPGEYQICKLKVIGWYVAAFMAPRP